MPQLALKTNVVYTPVLTCSHCDGTSFHMADGPTGRRLRCATCNHRADAAMCSCGNGYGAHGAGGCMGLTEDGEPCPCQFRGGR